MTTDAALFPAPDAVEIPGLPDCFSDPEDSARIIDGIPVWWEADGDEPGYEVLYAHTHDERKALEIAERMRMASEFDAIGSPEITQSGWCRLVTECGCTPEQHAEHEKAWEEDGAEQCRGVQASRPVSVLGRPDLRLLDRGRRGWHSGCAALSANRAVMTTKPRVFTLCGSSRFKTAFDLMNLHLSQQGHVVFSLGMFGHVDHPEGARFLTSDSDGSNEVKQRLDRVHFEKINRSDAIVVINLGGYVGSSTGREIAYALDQGKEVRWMFPDAIPADFAGSVSEVNAA